MTQEQTSFPVHLNEATAEELRALPGIGPVRAEAIIAHREAHGPFARVEDLRQVEAVPERVYEAIRDLLTVEPRPAAAAPQAPPPEEGVEAREEVPPEAAAVPEPPPPSEPEVPPRVEVAPPPPPPPPREPSAAPVPPLEAPRRARRFAADVLLVVLGALLGTALTLLILLATNGTLLYSGRGALARLEVQAQGLQEQNRALSDMVAATNQQVADLEREVVRIPGLEEAVDEVQDKIVGLENVYGVLKATQDDLKRQYVALQGQVNTLSAQVDTLSERMAQAETRLTSLEEMRGRLVRLLTGVRDLLQEALGPLAGE